MNTVETSSQAEAGAFVGPAGNAPVEGIGASELVNKMINIPHPLVAMTEVPFHFKKDKELGGEKRPTIKLQLPFLTVDGLVAALQDAKQLQLILDVVNQEVYKAARVQVGDDVKPVNSQADLDLSKLTLEFIANQPAAERRGGGIAKEVWEAFAKDYTDTMLSATGKTPEQVGNAVKILMGKFQPVKTNKKVIAYVREQLAMWVTKTQNLEEFQDCFEFLDNKAETLLAADEAKLLENL